MTGMANKEIQKLALEHGADAFIAKPFSLLKLEEILRQHAY